MVNTIPTLSQSHTSRQSEIIDASSRMSTSSNLSPSSSATYQSSVHASYSIMESLTLQTTSLIKSMESSLITSAESQLQSMDESSSPATQVLSSFSPFVTVTAGSLALTTDIHQSYLPSSSQLLASMQPSLQLSSLAESIATHTTAVQSVSPSSADVSSRMCKVHSRL